MDPCLRRDDKQVDTPFNSVSLICIITTMFKSLSTETKIFLGIIAVTILLLGGAIAYFAQLDSQPPLTRDDLIAPGTHTKGSASASAFLVEFSDFECPACGSYYPSVKATVAEFGDQLTFAYRHLPLPQHPSAIPAAKAAEAAGRQGKFWEMHDKLFENQTRLNEELIQEIATQLGLDLDQFNQDLQDEAVSRRIEDDLTAANRLGVNSTPTFFLNGKKLIVRSPDDLRAQVAAGLTP